MATGERSQREKSVNAKERWPALNPKDSRGGNREKNLEICPRISNYEIRSHPWVPRAKSLHYLFARHTCARYSDKAIDDLWPNPAVESLQLSKPMSVLILPLLSSTVRMMLIISSPCENFHNIVLSSCSIVFLVGDVFKVLSHGPNLSSQRMVYVQISTTDFCQIMWKNFHCNKFLLRYLKT